MKNAVFGPAIVEFVCPRSPAAKAGIRPGDMIIQVDGEPMRDLIDFYLLVADDVKHEFRLQRGKELLDVIVESRMEGLGVQISEAVFGPVMTCDNSCIFCFVDQLPEGLRPSVYVKDDDYRLSFLQGNFITLTNLEDDDIERILAERLSPLYVSLHATDHALRRRIFGNPQADRSLSRLQELLDGGIEVHIQIVLMRGINDGVNLDRTLADLSSDYRTVASVGIVPVGVSSSGARTLPSEWVYEKESSVEVLDLLENWTRVLGKAGPFASDEFFYLAGRRVPSSAYYNDFPQVENGIGLTRIFHDEFLETAGHHELPQEGLERTAILTSQMGAWALDGLGIEDTGVRLVSCENSLFGPRVNVCGLLPGRSVAQELAAQTGLRHALVPGVALDASGTFIDGITLEQVTRETGIDLTVVPSSGEDLVTALLESVETGGS